MTLLTVVVAVIILSGLASARVIHIRFDESSADGSGDTKMNTEFDIDLGELGVEFFQNGTETKESLEHLISVFKNATKEDMPEFEATDDADSEGNSQRSRRTIFSHDERLPVDNTGPFPYCAVGRIDNGCTAAFIGPYHAITAAHCVYNKYTNTWKTNLNMWRGRTCNHKGERMYWRRVRVPTGFTRDHRQDVDYALIIYDQNNPSPCRLSFGYLSNWPDVGMDIFGYPQDKSSVSGCSYQSMWFTSCHYSDTANYDRRLKYRCDVLGGNNGAPLYAEKKGDSSGKRLVYGIHTHSASTWNYGNRINKSRFCRIVGWMKDSGYTPMCGGSPCCS